MNAIPLTIIVSFVYAVFLPLQLSTTWLCISLLIYLFGIILTAVAILNLASAPKNRLVTKGLSQVTRNPVYVGMLLMQTGIAVACTSWLYLLLTVVSLIAFTTILSAEERYCLENYGDAYRKYMSRTPRWIGIPKSGKKRVARELIKVEFKPNQKSTRDLWQGHYFSVYNAQIGFQ